MNNKLDALIKELKLKVLRSELIEEALVKVDRKFFVPKQLAEDAYLDTALPIGQGQTISQPYTVVFMLQLLDLKPGFRVMDVGSGSGWQSALIAQIVGEHGRVYAIERIPELCEQAKGNIKHFSDLKKRIFFYCQDATPGLTEESRQTGGWDRIIAAASLKELPQAWRDQLKIGGIMVYPMAGSIFKEIKRSPGRFEIEEHPGFVFVPFVQR